MKTKGLPAIAVVAILLAAVLAPAVGLSLLNNSNSSVNSNESLNESINSDPEPEPGTPTTSPPIEDTANGTDTEANQTETETVNESVDVIYDSTSTPKPVIIMFKDKSDADLIKQHGGQIKSAYRLKPALAASLSQKAIDSLRTNPKIEFVVDDLQIFTMAEGETLDLGVDRIDADVVHESNNNGTGINVAIMDTGIDYDHPDLAANYEGGYDFGGGYSGAPNDNDPMDYGGHGTHCAGIVAAVRGNEIGVIGVAPEADLYAVKVFTDDGYGSYSDVVEALEWCVDTRTDGDPNNDIQVISMSFGSEYSAGDPGIESWINAAYDAGILLVGAAGNDGKLAGVGDNVGYPARYDSVIAVAATDSSDNRASFSSTGSAVELAAPGVSIYSTYLDNGYAAMSGTSMACPHVTGTAALVWNAYPEYSNTEVRQRTQATAEDLGAAGRDTKYGYGLVNASEAASPTGSPNESPVVATPRTYDNTTLEEKTVFERNDSMFINVSISDINGASDRNTVLITILNTTNATIPILNNDTMTQDTPITDGYVYNYSWKVPGDAESGTWTLKVYANDTGGNVGSASVQFVVNLTNATVPENKNITVDLIAMKKHFALNKNPEFKFIVNSNTTAGASKANETDAGLSGFDAPKPRKALKMLVTSDETIKTAVYYKDELVDIAPEIEKLGEGDFSIKIPAQRAFRAGLYKLKVVLVKDNKTYVEEQDFTWGVLAINTHKSIYLPDETAFIGMAVLDNEGHMVCDAGITLTITDPDNKETVLSTSNGSIKVSPECSVYGVTNLPDYYTNYVVGGGVGTYVMTLTAVTADGTGTKSITDEFSVQNSVEFDVARDGPTRIYPPVPYVMKFTIKANKNYTGLIKEYVPALFEITAQEGLTVTTVGDTKILTWNKNFVTGENYNIYYGFDAPDISPYLFVLGELEIGNWQEARQWQIASDIAESGDPYLLVVQGAPEEKSETWWEWIVVNPTDSTITVTEVRVKDKAGNDWKWTPDNVLGYPTSGWTYGDTAGYYWSGSETVSAHSAKMFRSRPKAERKNAAACTMEWTATITDYSPAARETTVVGIDRGSWGGMFYNKPDDTAEQTEAGTYPNGLYAYLDEDTNGQPLSAGTEYTFYVNVHEWADKAIAAGGTLTITIPKEFTGVTLVDKADFSNAGVSGGGASDWTITGTNNAAISDGVQHLSFNATTPTGYSTNSNWEFDTKFTGTGDRGETVRYICEANVLVQAEADITPPQWSDPQTNKTTIYQNDYVKFTVNWTDDVALAGYKFSINQSGAWINSSFVPFSGTSNISENVTQITASAGTTIGWKFYANDTSDNWNVTDIRSFVVATPPPPPSTPYMIYGWVFYKNGTACNSPVVNITNMNNSKQWSAKTNASYNYYQLMLSNGTDLNASEILRFNVRDASGVQSKMFNHTVNETEVNDGGLFNFNITLVAPETPFMIYGWVFYADDSECLNPTVNITNTNTSTQWQAETNASYNFYQLILDTTNISAGNVLEFNATDGTQSNVTNHTVTQKNITDGGIFDFNLSIGIEEPVKIRNYNNSSDLDNWAFSGGMGENVTVSWQNSSNGTPTCVIWNSGTDLITVCIYATNFTDGDGVQFNPNATEKIVVRDDGNTTLIDWSVVTDYVSNKNESLNSWYNFPLEAGGVRDVYLQLCIPMNVKSGTYNSTFYAKKKE